jgi:hypothetical protein
VLIILTEDQGSQMSFVGTPGLSTPNMDRTANEGVYFNQAFVNYPVCSPSKASIYTGTYCHTNGQMGVTTNWHGPADTMPKLIAEDSKKCVGMPSVVQVGKRLALFYDAPGADSMSHMGRDIGLAWFDLPLMPPTE